MYGQLQCPVPPAREAFTMPETWKQANALLCEAERRGRSFRLLGKSRARCRLERRGAAIAVRLYNTDILTFHRNGSRTINTGGWQTPTTRRWLRACGVGIFLSSGVVDVDGYAYRDGMRLLSNGKATGHGGPVETVIRARARNLRRDRKAETYCAWRWEHRQGGWASGGNCPEAFAS